MMKEILMQINSDKLSWDQICDLDNQARKVLGENSKMLDVLWQMVG